MEDIILKAERRKIIGKKSKSLRREGKLPAVIYGHGIEPTPITLDMRDASRTLASVGSSTLVTIDLDGEEHSALVRERQKDIMLRTLLHVDFLALSLTETVQTTVRIVLGDQEAPAVKDYGAMIISELEELQIECLPKDLPESIEVDISGLESIGDNIMVKDLNIPASVTVFDDPEAIVVVATSLSVETVEEEEEAEEDMVDMDVEPEVIEKGYQDEEEE